MVTELQLSSECLERSRMMDVKRLQALEGWKPEATFKSSQINIHMLRLVVLYRVRFGKGCMLAITKGALWMQTWCGITIRQ